MKRKTLLLAGALSLLAGVVLPLANAGTSAGGFSVSLYRALAANQEGRNFTFSPYSISQAFGIAELGARGETRREIEGAVDLGLSLENAPEIAVANRIWIQKGSRVEPAYLKESKAKYGASPGILDFVHHPDPSTRTINAWVEEQTHHKIKNLIPPNTLNESSRLVLTNAIYFKAPWEFPFIQGDSFDDDFVLSGGRKARVPFMHERKHLKYADAGNAQVLQLPYAGYRYTMTFVLPKEGTPLSRIEQELSAEKLREWNDSLKQTDVRVGMPRFRFDSSFLLNAPLKEIGIRRAFTTEADFSGIDGAKDLYVAQVFHKAFLNVNEAGTEAAASTAIHMMMKAAMPTEAKPIEFTANRPFLFYIQETNTKTIVFLGRLANPRD